MTHDTDPLNLQHRVHVSLTDDGYRGRCTCGWTVTRTTREQRDHDSNEHITLPRSQGSHGLVSEGD